MQWKLEFTSSVHNCFSCPHHRCVYSMDRYALVHTCQAHK